MTVTPNRLAYSISEASVLVGVSERTLHRLIADDRLSSVRFGRRRVIPTDSLLNYFGSGIRSKMSAL
jgi:excisionase family DNA binding protein